MIIVSDKFYKYGTAILLAFIFFFVIAVYDSFIYHTYEYIGFRLVHSPINIYLAIVIFIFSLIVLVFTPVKPVVFATSVIIKFLFLIPCLILFAKMDTDIRILISVLIFDFGFIFISFYNFNVQTYKLNRKEYLIILSLILILLLIPIIQTYGTNINLNLLLLKDIYVSRLQARTVDSVLSSYSVFWLCKVIIPVVLIFGLVKKKKLIVLFSIISLIFVFLVAGAHKSLLFSLFIFLFFYFFSNYYKKVFAFTLGIFALLIIGISFLNYFHHDMIADLLIRRTILDASLMDVFYFDFFDNNHMYLSHSFLKGYFTNPYGIQPSYVIGQLYLNNSANNAGSGIIGDGFMNFGMYGVLLSLSISLIILNYLSGAKINSKFFGLIFIVIYGFSATGIFTNILNGGIFLLILITQFMLKNNKVGLIKSD